jgi:hypothetical protein
VLPSAASRKQLKPGASLEPASSQLGSSSASSAWGLKLYSIGATPVSSVTWKS